MTIPQSTYRINTTLTIVEIEKLILNIVILFTTTYIRKKIYRFLF